MSPAPLQLGPLSDSPRAHERDAELANDGDLVLGARSRARAMDACATPLTLETRGPHAMHAAHGRLLSRTLEVDAYRGSFRVATFELGMS